MLSDTLGLVLAGGRGRRMGGADKALLALGGRPLAAHVADRLAPQVAALAISANGDPARLAAFGLPVLPDTVPGQPGPLAGVLAGLEHAAARGFGRVLTVPTDTPFLPADLAERLLAAAPGANVPVSAASNGRRHHAVALWRTDAASALHDALAGGERRLGRVAAFLGCVTEDWGSPARDPFFNVNTPQDLAAAQRAQSGAH